MPSFPLIEELPPVIETHGWTWGPIKASPIHLDNFWLGVDRQGNRWLTKLRGAFYAYREITFAKLAQRMKWSCQSSVFMRLDEHSARTLGASPGEVHAAHWFLDEHLPFPPCSPDCERGRLNGREIRTPEDLAGINISHLLDWPKGDMAACLFGANEDPQQLFTKSHELVIIDSETMFTSRPCSFEDVTWLKNAEGQPSPGGSALALEVCQNFASLSMAEIEEALQIPANVAIQETWPIAPLLQESRRFADRFCANYEQSDLWRRE